MQVDQGSDRRRRAARNQALFRDVNDRLEELADGSPSAADTIAFVCECSDIECSEQLEMTVAEYEEIRSDGNSFAVAPGHVAPDVERVERENHRYVVVAKLGEAAAIAKAINPRSR
jgi:hypothetical protein